MVININCLCGGLTPQTGYLNESISAESALPTTTTTKALHICTFGLFQSKVCNSCCLADHHLLSKKEEFGFCACVSYEVQEGSL